MVKIAVGDEFEWIGEKGNFYTSGKKYKVQEAPDEDGNLVMEDDGTGRHWWDLKGLSEFFLPVKGPIREVRRREIVPGVYGCVVLEGVLDGKIKLFFESQTSKTSSSLYSAQELREAAHLFNQLAEFLDEEGK